MRVICPVCGVLVKLNSRKEISLHYGPPDDVNGDTYDLPCEMSRVEYEDENENEEVMDL